MSEIRYDRLHDRHVIIAPERLHRPDRTVQLRAMRKESNICPFCEGNEAMTPSEIFALRDEKSFANKKGWHTRVVPNLYKAVQIETPYKHHYGLFEYWDGFGAHEVIIDTPEHYTSMVEWHDTDAFYWLKTLQVRVNDLKKESRIAYISLFKNEGKNAGATQEHCHTQLIGLPLLPKRQKEEYQRVYAYYEHNKKSLIAFILEEEERAKESRIIAKKGDFIAYCPYASSHPFEIMISSKKALGEIDGLGDASLHEIASLLLLTLKKLASQVNPLDFNLSISTPPLHEGEVESELFLTLHDASRFYIRIIPRIYKYGGFEESTDIMINPVAPELAAKLLREHREIDNK